MLNLIYFNFSEDYNKAQNNLVQDIHQSQYLQYSDLHIQAEKFYFYLTRAVHRL